MWNPFKKQKTGIPISKSVPMSKPYRIMGDGFVLDMTIIQYQVGCVRNENTEIGCTWYDWYIDGQFCDFNGSAEGVHFSFRRDHDCYTNPSDCYDSIVNFFRKVGMAEVAKDLTHKKSKVMEEAWIRSLD